jgi:hypothetical protein
MTFHQIQLTIPERKVAVLDEIYMPQYPDVTSFGSGKSGSVVETKTIISPPFRIDVS